MALRKAWLFVLRVCAEFTKIRISEERALTSAAFAGFKFDAEREARADANAVVEHASDIRANAEAVERVRAKIFELDPRSLELLVQYALERTGFVEVSVTRYTADILPSETELSKDGGA